jgi:N-acetyl-anhydromuramyl-L-alanine amidase AmpD
MSYAYLLNFNQMPHKEFWNLVKTTNAAAKLSFQSAWADVGSGKVLSEKEAQKALNNLFIYSHQRILEKGLDKIFPTQQMYVNALSSVDDMWWVDHYTAGINMWSTLNWFSSRKKPDGKFNGASTHFVQDYHGDPMYLISLHNGAWHEPRKNKDSIAIEMVNAGKMFRNEQGEWRYWANAVPQNLIDELPPVAVTPPYKGASYLQPFTLDQVVNNIKLKRLVKMAIGERLSAIRMSQHSDWRDGKSDMGPMWPFADCNGGVFTAGSYPVDQLSFIQDFENSPLSKPDTIQQHYAILEENKDSPEYGVNVPTNDDDEPDYHKHVLSVVEARPKLDELGFTSKSKVYDAPFRQSVEMFQAAWNHRKMDLYPEEVLVVDGILGPKTTIALLAASKQFGIDNINWR